MNIVSDGLIYFQLFILLCLVSIEGPKTYKKTVVMTILISTTALVDQIAIEIGRHYSTICLTEKLKWLLTNEKLNKLN